MRKSGLILILLILGVAQAYAQLTTLKGSLVDTTKQPIVSATVTVLNPKDSTLLFFGITDAKGNFSVKGRMAGNYLLHLSHIQHIPVFKPLRVEPNTAELDLGTYVLKSRETTMNEIVIEGDRTPMQIRKDTVDFNAKSFQVQPNSNVEQLLKKIPGIEVEQDGTIKAQGETVTKVLVDGKVFFDNDPQAATKNLPADAIDRVQIFDRMSDLSEFTGVDDGNREKTINLRLKPDHRKGKFGTATLSYGDNDRFSGKLNFNAFRPNERVSIIGLGNNINQQGFSFSDYQSFVGNLQGGGGGRGGGGGGRGGGGGFGGGDSGVPISNGASDGFSDTWAGGVNYFKQFSKKTDLNASYMFSSIERRQDQLMNRTDFLPTGNFFTDETSNTLTGNDGHRLNLILNHKIDSLNTLRISTNVSLNETLYQTDLDSRSSTIEGITRNSSARDYNSNSDNLTLNSNILYRHNFLKRGRSFSSQLTLGLTDSDQEGFLDTRNSYFNTSGIPPREELILQDQQTVGYRNNYGLTLSYTEPIAKRKYLEFNYNYRASRNESDKDVFDIVGSAEQFNTNLSNHYVNSFDYHRAGVNYRMVHQDYNISIGVSAQEAQLNGDFIDRNLEIKRNFTNILPAVRMQYNFTQTTNLNFTYETNIQEPSITQLQPVVDNSNPLNISLGNPDLKPEYQHRLRLRFGQFNPATFQNFFGFVSLDYSQNDISYSQNTDSSFIRTSQPINVDYGYRVNSFLNYGFRIKALSLRVRFNGGLTFNKSNSLVNTQENFTSQWAPRAGVNFNYLYKDKIDLSFDANLRYTSTEYSLPTSEGQEFYTQIYTASAFFRLPKGFAIGSTLNYNVYSGLGEAFDGGVPLWGAYLSKYVLKNNRGEIKFSTTDMLNRNVGISQNADVNYVEETRIASLGRYFLLGFTYSLQALNKGQGGDRRGDMIRIIGQ